MHEFDPHQKWAVLLRTWNRPFLMLSHTKPGFEAVMGLPFDSKGVASHGYERDMGVDLLRAR